MCGIGDESNVLIPTIVSCPFLSSSAVMIGAGAGHSMIVFKNTK